jgi:hypothetical protein
MISNKSLFGLFGNPLFQNQAYYNNEQKAMMPLPPAANDASPLTFRNDAARFARNDAMFAHMCRRHTSSAKRHHCRRQHHLPVRTNIIE